MVLSTEINFYTNIITQVMLLVAPISGLTVKISRFSLDPTIAYIHQHLFKIYYFQFEHCYDTSQKHAYPIFLHLFIKFVFTARVYCSRIFFMVLFSIQFSALHYYIFSVYTDLNLNRMFFSTFQIFLQNFNKEYYKLEFLQQFFNTCYLF